MEQIGESSERDVLEEQPRPAESRTQSDTSGAEHVPTDGGVIRLDPKDRHSREKAGGRRNELIREYARLDVRSVIRSVPELNEKVDLLNCDRGVFIIREKDHPDAGVLGFDSKSDESVFFRLNFSDSRAPNKTLYKRFGAASVADASYDYLNEHLQYSDSEKDLDPYQMRRKRQAHIEAICKANGIKQLTINGFVPEDEEEWSPQDDLKLAYLNTWGEEQSLIQTAHSDDGYDTAKPYPTIDTGVIESYHGDNSW
jgi:hypothetical protein